MCHAQRIAYRFRYIAAVDVRTITISLLGVLDAPMGLTMTGIDYFVDDRQVRETNILASTENQKKDSLYSRTRAMVKRNSSAEGRTAQEIHRRGQGKVPSTCGGDRSCITALF